jgi:hypothetical protein
MKLTESERQTLDTLNKRCKLCEDALRISKELNPL